MAAALPPILLSDFSHSTTPVSPLSLASAQLIASVALLLHLSLSRFAFASGFASFSTKKSGKKRTERSFVSLSGFGMGYSLTRVSSLLSCRARYPRSCNKHPPSRRRRLSSFLHFTRVHLSHELLSPAKATHDYPRVQRYQRRHRHLRRRSHLPHLLPVSTTPSRRHSPL